MASLNLGVYTTVFPNAVPFLAEFSSSLGAQTDLDFDLWVGLDRLEVAEVEPHLGRGRSITWVPRKPGDTFATVRQRAWNRMIAQYDAVVLVDSDDILLPERVSRAREELAHCDVYGCALHLVSADGASMDATLKLGDAAQDWTVFLSTMNIFGLSNTAYRSPALAAGLPLPQDLGIIDWHLVSRSFAAGARLHFDDTPLMDYRQYEATTAKIVPPFTVEDLRSSTGHVLLHYQNLLPHMGSSSRFQELLVERQRQVKHFATLSDERLAAYARAFDPLPRRAYRWWEIVAKKELSQLWCR